MKARGIFSLYQKALNRRPYLIQAIQAGTLMGAGDITSQTLFEDNSFKHVDYKRSLKFASIGFFIGGPTLRMWYGVLNRHVGSQGKIVAVKKVLVDQLLFAPSFLGMILVCAGTMQGKTWDKVKSDVQANYFDVLQTNYYIWPWVQLVNFYFVPLQYQVLLVQTVALFWNTYLAWKTNRKRLLDN
ncbi:hypothetical protein O3G_MSEX008252 [Manduca sexta]|uniref:Mitochondrial inner membrane protein Mpv17 n=1 Tax=Manduca sexta TaxID=7130 RepID=A0A921Z9W2_MANSE|nr:hypothetical protein O3G_MSEX008252 [Manduca sexta]